MVVSMWKEKVQLLCEYITKHSKIAFPVIVIAAAAVTVTVALNAGAADDKLPMEETTATDQALEAALEAAESNVPLVENEDGALFTLMNTYYNAVALGDEETLLSVCDEISEKDMLRYVEMAKYIESYPVLEIYTKPGTEEGATVAFVYYKVVFSGHEEELPGYQAHYVCTDENGNLYLKRGENTDEVNQYIKMVSAQDDVVEFNNRITVEYNELMVAHPELLEYLSELDAQVSTAVGEALAAQQSAENEQENVANAEGTETAEGADTTAGADTAEGADSTQQEEETANVVQYATATTTVNVRSSDSEKADKLGKVPGGTKVQVLEQRMNGWSKIVFENQEGYIKSEFLQMDAGTTGATGTESAAGAETIGKVTATTNVNVRVSASESADTLGIFAGGDSAELLANENGWCKINYNGKIGYVKADFVEVE